MSTRIRQVVIAARELEPVVQRLRAELDLGEPFSDEGVGWFGLRNAVFALGDTFLEVVSPMQGDTAAGRLLDRRGRDCGYMVMLQVPELASARERAQAATVREVFEVSLEDIEEVHLHPADMRGAIVSLSTPKPAAAWRWGGPDWEARAAALRVQGLTVGVSEPDVVRARWTEVAGELPAGLEFVRDPEEPGLIEILVGGAARDATLNLGSVRLRLRR